MHVSLMDGIRDRTRLPNRVKVGLPTHVEKRLAEHHTAALTRAPPEDVALQEVFGLCRDGQRYPYRL